MINIHAKVTGGEQIILRLKSIPENVHNRLMVVIKSLSIALQGKVVNDKLSGQVLKRPTGTLARSIQWDVKDDGTSIVGIVGSGAKESKPLKYAHIHEYGFNGVVNVREHLRNQVMAFGRTIEPRQVTVRAHAMHMNMPERSFMRSALNDMRAEITAKIKEAAQDGANKK